MRGTSFNLPRPRRRCRGTNVEKVAQMLAMLLFMLLFRQLPAHQTPVHEEGKSHVEKRDADYSYDDQMSVNQGLEMRMTANDDLEDLGEQTLDQYEKELCDEKAPIVMQTAEEAIEMARGFNVFPLRDNYIGMVKLINGYLIGLTELDHDEPIEVHCSLDKIEIHATLVMARARSSYDWVAPLLNYAGIFFSSADDIELKMTASILSSEVDYPTVRIDEMKLINMSNYQYGSDGPDVFDSFGEGHQFSLFKSVFTNILENVIKDIFLKQFQLLISQSWYKSQLYTGEKDFSRSYYSGGAIVADEEDEPVSIFSKVDISDSHDTPQHPEASAELAAALELGVLQPPEYHRETGLQPLSAASSKAGRTSGSIENSSKPRIIEYPTQSGSVQPVDIYRSSTAEGFLYRTSDDSAALSADSSASDDFPDADFPPQPSYPASAKPPEQLPASPAAPTAAVAASPPSQAAHAPAPAHAAAAATSRRVPKIPKAPKPGAPPAPASPKISSFALPPTPTEPGAPALPILPFAPPVPPPPPPIPKFHIPALPVHNNDPSFRAMNLESRMGEPGKEADDAFGNGRVGYRTMVEDPNPYSSEFRVPEYRANALGYRVVVPEYRGVISEHGNAVPEYRYAIPEYWAAVPEYRAAVPEHRAAVPEYRAAVPEHRAAVPEYMAAIPQYRAVVPERRAVVPEYRAAVPEHRAEIPKYMAAVPGYRAVPEYRAEVPEHRATVPEYRGAVPEHSAAAPEYRGAVPEYKAAVPEEYYFY